MLILIADDDANIRGVLSDFFKKRGHQPLLATEGPQVVALARNNRPDIILLDVMMPGGYGTAAMKAIREAPEIKDTPIIFITGVPPEKVGQLVTQDAKTRILPKPINVDQLDALVGELTS